MLRVLEKGKQVVFKGKEISIKSDKPVAVPTGSQVQGIGKLQTLPGKINGQRNDLNIFQFHIGQAKGFGEGVKDVG